MRRTQLDDAGDRRANLLVALEYGLSPLVPAWGAENRRPVRRRRRRPQPRAALVWLSPDCRDGKCRACSGQAWDEVADAPTSCGCSVPGCHPAGGAA